MDNPHASPVIEAFYALYSGLSTSFSGHGIWGPQQTVACLLALLCPGVQRSYRTMLPMMNDRFGAAWGWNDVPDPRGFTDARHRLGCETIEAVTRGACDRALSLSRCSEDGPQGRRLVAFDGTDLALMDTPGSRTRFRGPTNVEGALVGTPHALMVSAWDVVARVPLGWTLQPYGSDEREGALALLPLLAKEDIAVFDRGYPSYAFLRSMALDRQDFVIRMIGSEACSWTVVYEFLRSGERDRVVDVDLGPHPNRPGERVIAKIRLIRKSFRLGRPMAHQRLETTVIATTLIDGEDYPRDEILAIYANRWGIETIHKELKMLCAMENWHTTDEKLIRQEIAAIMLWQTLAAIIYHQAQQQIAHHQANAWNRPARLLALRTAVFVATIELLELAGANHSRTLWHARLAHHLRLLVRYAQKRRPGRSRKRARKRPFGRFRPTNKAA